MEDIDKTFEALRKTPYAALQKELLAKSGYLFSTDGDGNITYPDGAIEIIEHNGWTSEELVEYVHNFRFRS